MLKMLVSARSLESAIKSSLAESTTQAVWQLTAREALSHQAHQTCFCHTAWQPEHIERLRKSEPAARVYKLELG